jgi:3-oxoacyl-[acyl-carrier protein] reductase
MRWNSRVKPSGGLDGKNEAGHMFNLTGKTPRHRRDRRHRQGHRPGPARQGATVVLSGTREAVLQDLAKELGERAFARRQPVRRGLGRYPGPGRGAAGAPLDILVANAGITKDGLLMRM